MYFNNILTRERESLREIGEFHSSSSSLIKTALFFEKKKKST